MLDTSEKPMTHPMADGKMFTPEPFDPNGPWFYAADKKGWTNNPDQAYRTAKGHLVLAPGEVKRVSQVDMEKRAQLWEYLLDEMEKMYDLIEEESQYSVADRMNPDRKAEGAHVKMREQQYKVTGITDALAILEYGWTFKHEPGHAKEMIQRQAMVRYQMSVEQ